MCGKEEYNILFLVKGIFSPIHDKVSLFKYFFFILANILMEWNCNLVTLLLDLKDLLLTILQRLFYDIPISY